MVLIELCTLSENNKKLDRIVQDIRAYKLRGTFSTFDLLLINIYIRDARLHVFIVFLYHNIQHKYTCSNKKLVNVERTIFHV